MSTVLLRSDGVCCCVCMTRPRLSLNEMPGVQTSSGGACTPPQTPLCAQMTHIHAIKELCQYVFQPLPLWSCVQQSALSTCCVQTQNPEPPRIITLPQLQAKAAVQRRSTIPPGHHVATSTLQRRLAW